MHIFPCTVNPLQGTHDAWYLVTWCKSSSCSRDSDNKSWPFFFKKMTFLFPPWVQLVLPLCTGGWDTYQVPATPPEKSVSSLSVSSYQLSIAPLQRASGASLPSPLWSCAGLMQGTQLWEFPWVQRAAFHSSAAYPLVPCLVPSSTVLASRESFLVTSRISLCLTTQVSSVLSNNVLPPSYDGQPRAMPMAYIVLGASGTSLASHL